MRKSVVLIAASAVSLVAASAVLASGFEKSATSAEPVVAKMSYFSTSAPWMVWNKKTCQFQPTSKHPKVYVAQVRKLATPISVVHTSADPTISVYQTIIKGFQKYAKLGNVNLKILSNRYPSKTVPTQVARDVVQQKPAVVISDMEIVDLYPQIQAIYQGGCTPMIDMFHLANPKPPSPGFYAGYVASGTILGNGIVSLAKQKGWSPSDVWLVQCGAPLVANKPGTDLDVITTARGIILKNLTIPSNQVSDVLDCKGDPNGSRTTITDWLTAHPQAKNVIALSWSDVYTVGMVQALESKGFTPATAIAAGGQANNDPLQLMADGSILQVNFDKNFPQWGLFAISMAQDIAAGRPVPFLADVGVKPVVGAAAAKALLATRK